MVLWAEQSTGLSSSSVGAPGTGTMQHLLLYVIGWAWEGQGSEKLANLLDLFLNLFRSLLIKHGYL